MLPTYKKEYLRVVNGMMDVSQSTASNLQFVLDNNSEASRPAPQVRSNTWPSSGSSSRTELLSALLWRMSVFLLRGQRRKILLNIIRLKTSSTS